MYVSSLITCEEYYFPQILISTYLNNSNYMWYSGIIDIQIWKDIPNV